MPMAKNVAGSARAGGKLWAIGGTALATSDGLTDVTRFNGSERWSAAPLLIGLRSFTGEHGGWQHDDHRRRP